MTEQEQLIADLASYAYDPFGFVMWAFPWGEGPLASYTGPDDWQKKFLLELGDELHDPARVIRFVRASGHGVGKSALVAWLTLWAFSTFAGTRGFITANTEVQLKTRTWVELAKWLELFIGKSLLRLTATAMFAEQGKALDKTWRIDFVPWNEKNPAAFQGYHNKSKRLVGLMDEASEVADIIWDTIDGALTDKDTEIFLFAFGNPTLAEGRFRECFDGGRFAHRWNHGHVSGLDSGIASKDLLESYIADWGEDSDFCRIRVFGKFPRSAANTFISYELAMEAARRELPYRTSVDEPVILGVDVARFGDDYSVIYPRQGRDAQSREPEVYLGIDTETLANKVVQAFHRHRAAVAMVDGTGVGGGVVDKLRERYRLPVVDVQFGARPDGFDVYDTNTKYANKKTEMYGLLRHWLKTGAIVHKVRGYDNEIPKELSTIQYMFGANDSMQLVPKSMTKKTHGSPDVADALACTFAIPWIENLPAMNTTVVTAKDYNPFDEEQIYGYV